MATPRMERRTCACPAAMEKLDVLAIILIAMVWGPRVTTAQGFQSKCQYPAAVANCREDLTKTLST